MERRYHSKAIVRRNIYLLTQIKGLGAPSFFSLTTEITDFSLGNENKIALRHRSSGNDFVVKENKKYSRHELGYSIFYPYWGMEGNFLNSL